MDKIFNGKAIYQPQGAASTDAARGTATHLCGYTNLNL